MPSPTQHLGATAEMWAEAALIRQGYRIIARNWRGARAEIDRIAWDGAIVCFVEVRSRRSTEFGTPAETVDRRKQARIVRAAEAFLQRHFPGSLPMARFDVVQVVTGNKPVVEIIKNAFDAGR